MMSPSENEGDAKKTRLRPEPLCLFCFPEDVLFSWGKTYVNAPQEEAAAQRDTKREESFRRFTQDVRQKEKEEFWLRKRTEARIRRRRMKEPIRNLRSYLFTSVKNEKSAAKTNLPSLFEVLETVKDAWPSPPTRSKSLLRSEKQSPTQSQSSSKKQPKMKDEKMSAQFQSQLLNRRLSVPEELMRRYSVSKEKTSEESETNKTTVEISPSSSSTIETARWKGTEELKPRVERSNAKLPPKAEEVTTDAHPIMKSSEEGEPRKTDLPQRVTQNDYYKQGKRIIKVKAVYRDTCACTCGREPQSSTTVSAKDETDDSGTTESILSSSPTQLPKRESSSGNLSSESDNIRCTCAELSSMETSADFYLSGKSTLSQTVSDKSMSTQDSTVSVNSVSSRGSTVSDNSNSTTPEIERTSAKETTTSPDYSPRTPRNRKNRRRDKNLPCHQPPKTCPRHNDAKHSRNYLPLDSNYRCPMHSQNHAQEPQTVANASIDTNGREDAGPQKTDVTFGVAERNQNEESTTNQPSRGEMPAAAEERYKWAKLSQEELYMMQQLRHQRFIESQRKLSSSLPPLPDADSKIACGTGSVYKETERIDQTVMIPRYSALPRSLSMLVNTSSPETSHNSDSDNQSLADSLEDQPVTVHKLYFDTKKESKPVRGDASTVQDNKQKHKQPRGRAFFVSIKEPYGEDEMLENIEKIPQPPEKIKNQIFKRHLKLCAKHKHLHHPEEQKEKKTTTQRSKKAKNKNDNERISKGRKRIQEESKRVERRIPSEKSKLKEDDATNVDPTKAGTKKKEGKEGKGRFGSKIPVLVSGRSTSSSPEGDSETKEKSTRPKVRARREMEGEASPETDMETTQVLEIMHKGTELSLQKPQAVIHPSQVPLELKAEAPLIIPPLVSTLRIPPLRQAWNKQLLAPVRRSPIGKFRQRFEVIPEEKSSSLSSAEEKNGREGVSKFADASTSPMSSENIHFQSYSVKDVSNLIVAKITNKQLETLPSVHSSDNQKIILFSSGAQNSNSSKGRDALIAMNREDFNRLAKGWINFYKLNENLDNSETEGRSRDTAEEKPEANRETNAKLSSEKPKTDSAGVPASKEKKSTGHSVRGAKNQKPPELDENIRFDSSNTILRTAKSIPAADSAGNSKKQSSLPELKLPGHRNCEVHRTSCSEKGKPWSSAGKCVEDDDTDSDSTDYMEPPSPRVPPLLIGDIPSDATLSSSDSELDAPKPQITSQSLRYLQLKRRSTTNRSRLKKDNPSETSRCGKKKNSGWSVTVAGTVELSRSAPDLEMRLSFPASAGPPVVSQSDSGFAEESSYSKLSESLQELDLYTLRKDLPSGQRNMKQKWMVTVKNPKAGDAEELRKQFPNHHLPDLEPTQSRKTKKVLKRAAQAEEKMKRLVERKMRAIWPEVQRVIQKEFLTESGRLMTELEGDLDAESCLSVRGSAVTLERKQKPPTMTERDITRRHTSRTED